MNGGVAENYQYWRDHGGDWAAEYARRKTWMVLYHIQELMLTQYVLRHAAGRERPLRVLEFGCGVGRHLFNLRTLPNVDVHGYDQSDSMAGSIRAWAGDAWYGEHVHVGGPTGRLPYDDASFDLVYSAEVLVHVRPEDLPGVLGELMRVCRGHVLHLETSPDYPVFSGVHAGCWRHDLPATYASLGKACETLERGYLAHTPYRVTVAEPPVFAWDAPIIALYRRLEENIDRGFDVADAALKTAESGRRAAEESLATARANTEDLRTALERSEAINAQLAGERERAESLAARLATAEQDLAESRGQLAAVTAMAESLRADVAERSQSLAARERELVTLSASLAQAREALDTNRREGVLAAMGAEAQVRAWRDRSFDLEVKLDSVGTALARARAEQQDFVAAVRAALT